MSARCYWPPFCTYERTNSSAFSSSTLSISSRSESTSSLSLSCRSLTASAAASWGAAESTSSSLRLARCWPPPVSFIAIRTPGSLQWPSSEPYAAPPTTAGERAAGPCLSAGAGVDQLDCGGALVEQAADVGLGAAQRLEGRHPLQRVPAHIEDHTVPGGGGDLGAVPRQASAAEVGPGVLGRLCHRPHDGRLADQPLHPSPSHQPVVQALVRADVGVLQVDQLQPRGVPAQAVPTAVALEDLQLGHPVQLAAQRPHVVDEPGQH